MNLYMDRKREKRGRIVREIASYIFAILLAILLAFVFVFFIMQTTKVTGDSMSPTLNDHDKIVLYKGAYIIGKPERFDVVKFTITKSEEEHNYIKRVVALPGETIQIKEGVLYVDGKKLTGLPFDELIVSEGMLGKEMTLDDNEYFVLGDNINNSEDSRFANVGAVKKSEIDGKVIGTVKGWKIKTFEKNAE